MPENKDFIGGVPVEAFEKTAKKFTVWQIEGKNNQPISVMANNESFEVAETVNGHDFRAAVWFTKVPKKLHTKKYPKSLRATFKTVSPDGTRSSNLHAKKLLLRTIEYFRSKKMDVGCFVTTWEDRFGLHTEHATFLEQLENMEKDTGTRHVSFESIDKNGQLINQGDPGFAALERACKATWVGQVFENIYELKAVLIEKNKTVHCRWETIE